MVLPTGYRPEVPYNHSPISFSRFHYIDKERPPLSLATLTFDRAGAMLETYINALHVPLILENKEFGKILTGPEPHNNIRDVEFQRPKYDKQRSFITNTIGDYRALPSIINRARAGSPGEPQDQKTQINTSAHFAQDMHLQLRSAAQELRQKMEVIYFPTGSESDQTNRTAYGLARDADEEFSQNMIGYKKLYDEFRKLQKQHPNDAEKAKIFQDFLNSESLAKYDKEFLSVIERTKQALSPPALKDFFIRINGQDVKIDNTRRMNEDFEASYPALMLLALQSIGKHMIDTTYVPKQSFNFFTDVIGVESQISENLGTLNRFIVDTMRKTHITSNHDPLYNDEYRAALIKMANNHARRIQRLYTFHKTAGQLQKIYPPDKADIAYKDMEDMLHLAGIASPRLEAIETPDEMACLLFALDRRLRLSKRYTPTTLETLGGTLLELANNLHHCKTIESIPLTINKRIGEGLDKIVQAIKMQQGRHPITLGEDAEHTMKLIKDTLARHRPLDASNYGEQEQERVIRRGARPR